jgi:hypothetical protein
LARWLLGLGIAATLSANVAHGLSHGPAGAAVAAWPAVALVGSYELLMMVIHSSQVPADASPKADRGADPLEDRAAQLFAGQLAEDRVPSVRAIRDQLYIGQPGAQRLRNYLATGATRRAGLPSRVSSRQQGQVDGLGSRGRIEQAADWWLNAADSDQAKLGTGLA